MTLEAIVRALPRLLAAVALVALLGACASEAQRSTPPPPEAPPDAQTGTQAEAPAEQESGKLEPRYQPREPEPKPWYNSSLLFGMTRGVANSTIHPAGQVPLMVLTIPLDIAFLPFAAIGGFF